MHQKNILLLFLIIFLSTSSTIYTTINISPFIGARPQGMNSARFIQGISNYLHKKNNSKDGIFLLNLTPTYIKSNKSGRIADNLFGTIVHGTNWDIAEISIRGSGIADRDPKHDLLADYFCLPKDFYSRVFLQPTINNLILDINCFINLPIQKSWLYFNAPLTYSNWNLNYKEHIIEQGESNYQPGYFNSDVSFGSPDGSGNYPDAFGVSYKNLLKKFADYMSYGKSIDLGKTAQNKPIIFEPLHYAKFLTTQKDKKNSSGLADFHIIFGYDAIKKENAHITVGIYGIVPTGTRIKGTYAFEPVVGNNHHWELGTHLSSHYQFFYNWQTEELLSIYGILEITHPFSTKQKRTFDLKGKPLSRYMLAQKMTPSTNLFVNPLAGNATSSSLSQVQFGNYFAPIANLSTLDVNVAVPWHIDASFFLHYEHKEMTWDIGFNLWARGPESIKPCNKTNRLTNSQWALKGDAQVYGFSGSTPAPNTDPIALASIQPNASVTQGTNNFVSTNTNDGGCNNIRPTRNPGIINAQFARKTSNASGLNNNINDRPDSLGLQTQSSQPPALISIEDIDFSGAQTRNLSNSFFAGFSFQFKDISIIVTPFIALGGQAEFHSVNHITAPSLPLPCATQKISPSPEGETRTCGVSQWHVWLKAGAYFY